MYGGNAAFTDSKAFFAIFFCLSCQYLTRPCSYAAAQAGCISCSTARRRCHKSCLSSIKSTCIASPGPQAMSMLQLEVLIVVYVAFILLVQPKIALKTWQAWAMQVCPVLGLLADVWVCATRRTLSCFPESAHAMVVFLFFHFSFGCRERERKHSLAWSRLGKGVEVDIMLDNMMPSMTLSLLQTD